jgi:hypothetical protein
MGFASFFVLFRIILPQWSDIQDTLQLINSKAEAVQAKEQTIQLLNSLSLENVDADYNLVTTALPIQKDIVLIFSELNSAAAASNVQLGGFTVKVGGVYASDTTTLSANKSLNGIPFLNTLVNVSGSNEDVRKFAIELYKSIPLVEIKNIDISKKDARYDVNFYFKPITVRPNNADNTALKALTVAERQQLETLKTWNQ